MPTLSVAPVISSVPGSDPAPGEEHGKSTNDRVDWCHHLVKRWHLDLEPIDQSGSDQRDYPGNDERRKSPIEEISPCPRLRPLGYRHALMYRAVELLSEKTSRRKSHLSGDFEAASGRAADLSRHVGDRGDRMRDRDDHRADHACHSSALPCRHS